MAELPFRPASGSIKLVFMARSMNPRTAEVSASLDRSGCDGEIFGGAAISTADAAKRSSIECRGKRIGRVLGWGAAILLPLHRSRTLGP
jgi:hypothetical protein